ncbi:LLM class flavin-dependent oxidoreductase [Pseudoclavibacter endophyticus]|uniref:LLM class flavin-dependent oxidoreductase n=1 Tax=Pseudoclavibacter endophyticus TaxID=1778590 RepID=A0A6H9WJN7_9MICO|nr:LLM class flavin-dependent oxidoreductase [Pseudoclavibacter endophyticus]KAB1647859.1 LLM class flavin-dependent oxidoreductase [Pseudoclavibacter endophyticus]
MTTPLSVLDLAFVAPGQTPADAFAASVRLAQAAERHRFERVWYAEHHNMAEIASSATSVLIEHIASRTERIRVGAGGIMLPNHSPLTIAEQFGTLATLHPGRIDLGLGRAPGSDQRTLHALRRDAMSAESFPQDVVELQAYLRGASVVEGVSAYPGAGTDVELHILGSSLFGAQLAAALGLPYAFASHFAPQALMQAVAAYRERFEPSGVIDEPRVIVGANVIAAEDETEAETTRDRVLRQRARRFINHAERYTDEQLDAIIASPQGRQIADMMRYTAVGTSEQVGAWLDDFAAKTGADEIMIAFQSDTVEGRIRSLELTAASGAMAPAISWQPSGAHADAERAPAHRAG